MDYSIRPVDQKTHSIAPRRKQDGERAPFDLPQGEQRRPGAYPQPAPPPPQERAIAPGQERAIARGDGETGAHLDLSA